MKRTAKKSSSQCFSLSVRRHLLQARLFSRFIAPVPSLPLYHFRLPILSQQYSYGDQPVAAKARKERAQCGMAATKGRNVIASGIRRGWSLAIL
jgi:hypothetical protein